MCKYKIWKKSVAILFLTTTLWADLGMQDGLFISSDSNVTFNIIDAGEHYSYSLGGTKDSKEYLLRPTNYGMTFTELSYIKNGKRDGNVFAVINSGTEFVIQNKWDNSSLVWLKESPKFLNYVYVNSVKKLEKIMKQLKKENTLNSDFFRTLVEKYPLTSKNLTAYNNIAYYLQKRGAYDKALILLDMISKRFPNRTVTHLNYADSIVKFKETSKEDYSYSLEDAKHHYLSYIAQMLKAKKESKIPKHLKLKYKKYYSFLNILNSKIKKDYHILYLTEGDLDANGKTDISVVIEYADSSKISNTKSIWERPSNTNSRVWLVFLSEKNGYKLFRKNQQLISADEYTNCDDNFDSIHIKNNNLFLNTHFWCGSGGWEMGNRNHQFIYRGHELILAGSELSWNHRATTNGANKSANFLTKKLKIQKTKEFGEVDGKATWHKINIDRTILFEEYSLEMERELIGG